MTAPNGEIPEGAYVRDSMADLNEWSEESAMAAVKTPMVPSFNRQRDGVWQAGGLLSNLADLLFGIGGGSPAARLSDGMTDLNHRVELLDDVPGYAGAYVGTNRRFGAGGTYKKIPFDRPYGPAKKAHLDVSTNRMVLDEGSWSIHITIVPSAGGVVPLTIGHGVRVRVRNTAGAILIDRPFDWGHINWEHAQHFAMPIIVTEDGWTIEVGYRHNDAWWTLAGGTDKTLLWVERKNIDTTNSQIEIGVPNGPDIT